MGSGQTLREQSAGYAPSSVLSTTKLERPGHGDNIKIDYVPNGGAWDRHELDGTPVESRNLALPVGLRVVIEPFAWHDDGQLGQLRLAGVVEILEVGVHEGERVQGSRALDLANSSGEKCRMPPRLVGTGGEDKPSLSTYASYSRGSRSAWR